MKHHSNDSNNNSVMHEAEKGSNNEKQMDQGWGKEREHDIPILFLTSSIEDVEKSNFIINNALLSIRVFFGKKKNVSSARRGDARFFFGFTFNRRVVFIDKMTLDELDGQCRLSNAWYEWSEPQNYSPLYTSSPPPPTTTSLYSRRNAACAACKGIRLFWIYEAAESEWEQGTRNTRGKKGE